MVRRYAGMLGAMVARDTYSGVKRGIRSLYKRYKTKPAKRMRMLRGTRSVVRRRTARGLRTRVRNIVASDKETNIHTTSFLSDSTTIAKDTLYSSRIDDIGKGTETGAFQKKRDGWGILLRGFRVEYYITNIEATHTHTIDMRMLILADYTDYNDEIPSSERFFTGSGEGDFAQEALDFGDTRIALHQKLNRKINGKRYRVVSDKRIMLKPRHDSENPVRYGKIWIPRKHLLRFHEVTEPGGTSSKEVPKPIYRVFLFYQTSDNLTHTVRAKVDVKTYFKNT